MQETTDTQLIADAKNGDNRAFGQLVERYEWMVHHLALRLVGNEDIASDLAQEAFLQAYLSLKSLQSEPRFKGWLYGIVRNVCMDYLRKKDTTIQSRDRLLDDLLPSLPSAALSA
jgi:RNA polymerase sigma factor (sigma-70 family)